MLHDCAPVSLNNKRVREVDVQLNKAMRLLNGTLKAPPLPWFRLMVNNRYS